MKKQWKRLAALSLAAVMAAGTLLYFPSGTLQNIRWEIAANAENADAGNTGAVTWTKTEDDGLVWTLYDNGALTISGTGAMRDYAYNDKSPVYGNANITSLVIEDGVTRIGKNMCWGCSGLVDVMIPDSITEIGSFSFACCSSLPGVTIPESVDTIGTSAFQSCTNLERVTIPNSVKSIGTSAFQMCTALTSITIPESVTDIGEDAFIWCSSLASVEIPEGITDIRNGTFRECSSLESITIPSSVTNIDSYSFYQCTGLKHVTIPDRVTRIGHGVFAGCTSLERMTIPNSVTSIGGGVFEDCSDSLAITVVCGTALTKNDFEDRADSVTIMQHDFDANGFCQNDTTHYQPAEDRDGDGTYEISSAGQLYWFADKVNNGEYSLNAVLTADISVNEGDVSGCDGNKAEGWRDWTPIGNVSNIGNASNIYSGTFDG